MPGYLTHAMILTRAEQWLGELAAALARRGGAGGGGLSDGEETLLALARQAGALLRPPPTPGLPVTTIENGVGAGLAKHAFAGAIGMDFPRNGHIFALNRDWAGQTLHLGAPHRAYLQAGSTELALNLLKAAADPALSLSLEQQQAIRAFALGYLAGVATDVVLGPALNTLLYSGAGSGAISRRRLETQLDARVAQGFFRRSDLHEGQSWEDYFLEIGQVSREDNPLYRVFTQAFRETYGGVRPSEPLCAGGACRAPELRPAFLRDGYANTTNWAIDTGYDQSPWAWFKLVLGVLILGGGMAVVGVTWLSTEKYNLEDWREGRAWGGERLWSDLLGNTMLFSGVSYLPLSGLAVFPLPVWDGIFGQGLIGMFERPGGLTAIALTNAIYTGLSVGVFIFDLIFSAAGGDTAAYQDFDRAMQHPALRWTRFAFSTVVELLKAFLVDMGDAEHGREGDRLAFTMFWPVKVSTAACFLVSGLLVFAIKDARDENDFSGWDLVIGLILPIIGVAITWGTGFFENEVMERLTGSRWPSAETSQVDPYLPLGADRRSFAATGAQQLGVSLFAEANQGVLATPEGRQYFAESASPEPYVGRRERDEAARRAKAQTPGPATATLASLIEQAARLAAMLQMAAVNYNNVGAGLRDQVKAIFKDWNLDYRSVAEWEALTKESSGPDMGLLHAVGRWWDDLSQGRASAAAVIERIEQDLPASAQSGAILADFDHAGPAADLTAARARRLARPGAILLANLDLDDAALAGGRRDRRGELDALRDDAVSAPEDLADLALMRLRRPALAGGEALALRLALHAADARRVRIFQEDSGAAGGWARRLGAAHGGAAASSYSVPEGPIADFRLEALTLAGDPALPAPAGAAPFLRDGVTPAAPRRAPGDVWVELGHSAGGAEVPGLRDLALFTIAPWLMLSNLQPTERLYIVYIQDNIRDGIFRSNHPTVADVLDAMRAALGPARVPVQTTTAGGDTWFVPHQPRPAGDPAAAGALYLIDGGAYDQDPWIQDEIEIGYCWAPQPDGWMHVTVHTPRRRQLREFVYGELAGPRMGLFNSLDHPWDSINYGGNLEVSPPVGEGSAELAEGQAGLRVPAQGAAPFGKILLGEGLNFLTNLDPDALSHLDAGGAPSAALRAIFGALGIPLVTSTISVVTAGSAWRVSFAAPGPAPELRVRLEAGELNVYLVEPAGETLLGRIEPTAVADLDAGGSPSQRLQDAFNTVGMPLPAPEITVLSAGQEWLVTLAGMPGRPLLLVRKVGADLRLFEARIAEPAFRGFLSAQAVQPILSFDTAWLHVGHVDEVLVCVPADGGRGFRLVIASTRLATRLFIAARDLNTSDPALHPLTELYRGKQWLRRGSSGTVFEVSAAITVEDLLFDLQDSNDELQVERLTPIESRMKAGLRLSDDDIIHLPVYYDAMPLGSIGSQGKTSANTPCMVNLQVVDRHMLVPRPFGPRMGIADVLTILGGVGVTSASAARLAGLVGHWHWARRGATAAEIGAIYGVAAAAISGHARNSGKFSAAGAVLGTWERIWVPEDNVDLLEAYAQIVLEDLGLTVHWIDDWDTYHRAFGEVHCGTNVVRTPPEAAGGYSGPYWWEAYRP